MNCANYSALLHRQKLIWSHLLSLLPLYCVLLGSFWPSAIIAIIIFVTLLVAHVARLLFSVLSVLSCFCLYCCYIIYCMLPLEVNKVVQKRQSLALAYIYMVYKTATVNNDPERRYNTLHLNYLKETLYRHTCNHRRIKWTCFWAINAVSNLCHLPAFFVYYGRVHNKAIISSVSSTSTFKCKW